MTTLSLIDQTYIKMEQAGIPPMYMGGALILDPSGSPYPQDAKIIADHVAAFMEEVPLMRQKLVQDKMRLGNMRLVDDPNFDVNNHITFTRLKAPGGYKELTDHLGKFSSQHMDLDRPLWHLEIIEGLEGGRIALASHLHHSTLDGVGASRLLGGLMSAAPMEPRTPSQKNWSPEAEPTSARLAGTALLEQAKRMYVDAPKFAYENARPLLKALNKQLANRLGATKEKQQPTKLKNPKAQKTSLNPGQLSDKKVVAYAEFSLAEIKALKNAYDCTVNDVALFINSVALEHYFEAIGENIDFDLLAGMPISTRAADDDSVGISFSVSTVNLHNTLADPKQRLAAINSDTQQIKAASNRPANKTRVKEKSVDLGALGDLFSPIVLDGISYLVTRYALFEKIPTIANIGITNVPGPSGELYVSGSQVVGSIPMAPFGGPLALIVTISSMGDSFSIGYHGCGEAIDDKELLVAGAHKAFSLLQEQIDVEAKPQRKKPKAGTKTKAESRR